MRKFVSVQFSVFRAEFRLRETAFNWTAGFSRPPGEEAECIPRFQRKSLSLNSQPSALNFFPQLCGKTIGSFLPPPPKRSPMSLLVT